MSSACKGLTLVEMLVVLAIMAAVAGMVISLTDNLDLRTRQQESARRLLEVRAAILGPDAVSSSGELLSGGYLQDTGWLPDKAADLLARPEVSSGTPMPPLAYFPVWRTWAGWRGPYVTAPPPRKGDSAATLYDDWGNEFYGWFHELTADPSWKVERLAGSYPLRSMGADGKKDSEGGKTGVYEKDCPYAEQPLLGEADWVVDLTGLSAKVVNLTANDYSTAQVRLRIIVPRWDRSDPLGYSDNLSSDGFVSTAFALGVGPASGPAGTNQRVCQFICNPGKTLRIPLGRRMLFLVQESDAQPLPGVQAYAELLLSKRLSPPSCVTLEIRN